jgi:hypothetical protein
MVIKAWFTGLLSGLLKIGLFYFDIFKDIVAFTILHHISYVILVSHWIFEESLALPTKTMTFDETVRSLPFIPNVALFINTPYPISCYLLLPPIFLISSNLTEICSIMNVFHHKMVSTSVLYIII